MTRRACWLPAALLTACARRSAAPGCGALSGQTIRWIVPYSPGGSYDVFSRLLETPLEKTLGAELTIANEAGAGGMLGAAHIRDAASDGRTLGILNAPGLLAGQLSGQKVPHPARDFTLLGRIGRAWSVLATGSQSGLRTVDDLIALERTRPLLLGTTGPASNTFFSSSVATHLLGLRTRHVAGYDGSRGEMLAAMRGEVDLFAANFETLQEALEAGELRVIVSLAAAPLPAPALAGSALLGGEDGWAARRAAASGRTKEQAVSDAQALIDTMGAGMVAVGPKGIPAETAACLQAAFLAATGAPDFVKAVQASRRALDVAGARETEASLRAAEESIRRFAPIVQAAAERLRR